LKAFRAGEVVFRAEDQGGEMYLILQGDVGIVAPGSSSPVGVVRPGECLGEISLLTGAAHSSTAKALVDVETAVLDHRDLGEIIRLRPDIGLHLYRNLAAGLGEKLKRSGITPASPCASTAPDPARPPAESLSTQRA
jgi:CRP-like cAMP-binding protein